MSKILLLSTILLGAIAAQAAAQTHVDGYYRSNGTYVQPHYRSSPNDTVTDNYSFKGNSNPYTGSSGSSYYGGGSSSARSSGIGSSLNNRYDNPLNLNSSSNRHNLYGN